MTTGDYYFNYPWGSIKYKPIHLSIYHTKSLIHIKLMYSKHTLR